MSLFLWCSVDQAGLGQRESNIMSLLSYHIILKVKVFSEINCLVCKASENFEAPGDFSKYLVLSRKQSKTQTKEIDHYVVPDLKKVPQSISNTRCCREWDAMRSQWPRALTAKTYRFITVSKWIMVPNLKYELPSMLFSESDERTVKWERACLQVRLSPVQRHRKAANVPFEEPEPKFL